MKLIIAIVQDQDSGVLANALTDAEIGATQLKSTGSFLRSGNTTFLIGVEEEKIDDTLSIIKENCKTREQLVASPANHDITLELTGIFPIEVEVGGAVVFIVPVEQLHRY